MIGNNTGDLNIKKSYNTGTVNGYKGSAVGGIIGNAYQYGGNTSLVSCYNTGNISSDSYLVGGLIGVLNDDTTITACYNRGNISSGENGAGGLVGYCIDDMSVTSCYSTGDVSANKYGNKIYGASNSSAFTLSFSKVYQLKDADGSDNTDSGITTKDDSYFKSSDMITSLGSDYYESDSDSKYNDGYPILKDITYSN